MPKKFVFIGSGSTMFTRNLVRDLLTFPSFADAIIALVDIDKEHLEQSRICVDHIVKSGNYPATIIATTDRRTVLEGADGVLCTIQKNIYDQLLDIGIPDSYGVHICVGDTRGPQGIFRFLRTWPDMQAILHDMEIMCPDAVFLNYTNPMAMLCRAMQTTSKMKVTGLCHSVQGTAEMLAHWIGASMDDITYTCAGINHQAFYLEYKLKGRDAYPLIKKAVARPEIYNEEQVRNEMYLNLDYYPTESSSHNSEYNAWFRKRPDLLEKYCTHGTCEHPGLTRTAANFKEWMDQLDRWKIVNDWVKEPIDLKRGHEYAASIFNAIFGDRIPFEFNGNVRNFGLIDNLPCGACVEVPVVAASEGFRSIHVGKLPPQIALLVSINSQIEELAVEAALTGDPRKVFHAICFDPLTSALLSLEEIKNMTNDMLKAEADLLPMFDHLV